MADNPNDRHGDHEERKAYARANLRDVSTEELWDHLIFMVEIEQIRASDLAAIAAAVDELHARST